MKKVLTFALVALLATPAAYSADSLLAERALIHRAGPSKQDATKDNPQATVTIPAQTEAAIRLLSGIHTQVSHVGDPITARLIGPVSIDGRIVLPAGSLIEGEITRIRAAGRMRRPAELALRFDRITLPDGQDEPMLASLASLDNPSALKAQVDSEGHLRGTKGLSWKGLAGGLIGLGGAATLHFQFAGAAALGTTLPLGGGAMLGYAFLWPKGNEVHLPPETHLRIRLHHPLTIRVAW
ncbi:MAG: hypothetical protein ACE145_14040 [Terriglobia bacterium]